MAIPDKNAFEFTNAVGYEAFELIVDRMKELGPQSFDAIFSAVVGAASVCLANALGAAIKRPTTPKARAALADALIESCSRQVRTLVEPAVNMAN